MSEPSQQTIRMAIDSKNENISLVGLSVNRLCRHAGFDELDADKIELCLVEAVTNAIKHSYGGRAGHEVVVAVSLRSDRIELEVRDSGAGLPQGRLPKPRLEYDPNDIEHLPQGGMGLFIMDQIMDSVLYAERDGVNTLTLVKRRGKRPAADRR